MALLDLQGMETPAVELSNGSSNSGHSCTGSELSLLLCGVTSDLSVTACGH
ncbi:hypothetical protein GCM10009682_29340 [Luedemannella flava]|uniref:SapB/AmfS family lantipeptide n=1 Tax=Luedemannella flava TaxID=349316 RepID=A0ABN2M3T9_9ACTN